MFVGIFRKHVRKNPLNTFYQFVKFSLGNFNYVLEMGNYSIYA